MQECQKFRQKLLMISHGLGTLFHRLLNLKATSVVNRRFNRHETSVKIQPPSIGLSVHSKKY